MAGRGIISPQSESQLAAGGSHDFTWLKLTADAGGVVSKTFDTSGGDQTSFVLPATVGRGYVLSECVLSFKMNIFMTNGVSGAAPTGGADCGWVSFLNTWSWAQRLELVTNQGNVLLDYTRPDMGLLVSSLPNTNHSDLMSRDLFGAGCAAPYPTVTSTVSDGICSFMRSNNSLSLATGGYGWTLKLNAAAATVSPSVLNRFYTDPAQFLVAYSGAANGEQNGTNNRLIRVKIPMRQLYHTVFEDNMVRMYSENLVFRITWGTRARLGFKIDNATSTLPIVLGSTNALQSTITDMLFYVCVEQNNVQNAEALAALNAGYSFYCDKPNVENWSASGLTQNLQIKLNAARGISVKQIYHFFVRNSSKLHVQYNHGVVSKTNVYSITSWDQYFNGERRFPYTLTTEGGEDYMYIEPYLRGSAISTRKTYHDHFFTFISFLDKIRPIHEKRLGLLEGFLMSPAQQYTYEVNMTFPNNLSLVHWILIVGVQKITVNNSGVYVSTAFGAAP